LETLETLLGTVEGAFEALLEFEALIDEPIGHVVEAEESFAAVGAGEFPIIYGHSFDLDELSGSPGLPFGFEILKEAVECLGFLIGENEDTGAQPVAERVEADVLRISGSGTLESVLSVCSHLFSGSHKFYEQSQFRGGGRPPRVRALRGRSLLNSKLSEQSQFAAVHPISE
jgi:hypothetical protein